MEARIDIRKLQLLNDRITQTIDALNDVRMSTRGLSHSPAQPHGAPMPQGMGMQPGAPASQMQQPMPQSMSMPTMQPMQPMQPMASMTSVQPMASMMPMQPMASMMPMQPMASMMPMQPMGSMSMPMPAMQPLPMSGSMPCGPSQPAGSMPSAQPPQPAPAPVYTQLFAHVPFMGNGMGLQHSAPMMMPCMPWGMSGLYMPSAHDLERQMCELRACDLMRQAHTFPFMSA